MSETASTAAPAAVESPIESQESIESANPAESQAAASEASAPKESEIKRNLRKLQLKVDGKVLDQEIDLDDNEYLTKELQKARAFDKRSQEYSQLEKEVRSFVEELRKNPRKILSDPTVGIDVKKLAADIIEEEIANSQKSPEQLQREKLEAELKSLKEEREREKEESRTKEFERLQEIEFERYDTLMAKSLENSDLPKSPYVIKKMADYMLMGLQNNIDVTPDDVLPLVREEMQGDLKEMFALMPDEVIEALVGKDVFNRIRKKNVAKAKASPPQPLNKSVPDSGASKRDAKSASDKKQTYKDLFGF